ncbi:cysteine protease [Lithospermum erythrorhizon]|uniref:Cysteine protease n=1 Tax=Lithospermum erythrorhizon TaxID=34254 RepID=A0AAV3P927_LITER
MTRILVQRGSAGSSSSSNQNRSSSSSSLPGSSYSAVASQLQVTGNASTAIDDENREEVREQLTVDDISEGDGVFGGKGVKSEDLSSDCEKNDQNDDSGIDTGNAGTGDAGSADVVTGVAALRIVNEENNTPVRYSSPNVTGSSHPPPPPVPPPKAFSANSNTRRSACTNSSNVRIGSTRRATLRHGVSPRTSPTGSQPSSPHGHCDGEGYNSSDEHGPCFRSSYDDAERERQFEIDIRRAKGLEVKKMLEDGNCLFRAVADQVYGDSELYDLVRQMCVDYMERERDHFSQFVTEGFTSYCKRKRRDKIYGNNVEIQALAEMYNRPIHIYSYSTEPINTFHGGYATDVPPIRLSYHHGNHYNSLVDPRRQTVGAGLGFSSLRGTNVNKDQVKAAIKAQQDQQIDNALLAEGRFYSDLELTENEIEHMVMAASRAEYLATDGFKQQPSHSDSSTSGAEPSSSGARSSGSEVQQKDSVLCNSMQIVLSMGFTYMQAVEAYSLFGDDVDSMVCYLLETSSSSRRKGKATQ